MENRHVYLTMPAGIHQDGTGPEADEINEAEQAEQKEQA